MCIQNRSLRILSPVPADVRRLEMGRKVNGSNGQREKESGEYGILKPREESVSRTSQLCRVLRGVT